MVVKLKGKAKDAHSSRTGIYILGPNLVNGKSHWLQNPGTNAIWYFKDHWNIGDHRNLGSDKTWIFSPEDVAGPQEATTWKYYNDKWITSKDIFVEVLCKKNRIRKEVNDLTLEETKLLTQAFKNAIKEKTKGMKLEDIASYHGAPYKVCDGVSFCYKWKRKNENEKCLNWTQRKSKGCCPHRPGQSYIDFIIWHRLYLGMLMIIHNNAIIFFSI